MSRLNHIVHVFMRPSEYGMVPTPSQHNGLLDEEQLFLRAKHTCLDGMTKRSWSIQLRTGNSLMQLFDFPLLFLCHLLLQSKDAPLSPTIQHTGSFCNLVSKGSAGTKCSFLNQHFASTSHFGSDLEL